MGAKEFNDFVKSQQTTDVDAERWTRELDEWLARLKSLYHDIAEFLQEYIKNGSITYSLFKIQLSEQNIGDYLADRMDIAIGRQRVSITPIGTLIIGSKGRVDVVGSAGQAQILLVDERAKSAGDLIKVSVNVGGKAPSPPPTPKGPISWVWKIVTNTTPRRFVVFDKESFLALLMEVANA